jgi:peptide/nickel transport system substrate-binding protein
MRLHGSVAACAAVLVALALVACGGGSRDEAGGGTTTATGGSPAAGRSGGTLRIGIASTKIDSLNPMVGSTSLALETYREIYPYLLEYDAHNKLSGDWAKSYKISSDGLTWTFTTPAGARWADGKPLTAADAAWTINVVVKFRDGPAAQMANYSLGIKSAEAPTPTTLVVHLRKPTATVGNGLANIPILPEHIWSTYAAGNGARLKTFQNTSPVGAGPFKVAKYTANQFILFSRNPSSYAPAPKIDAFGFNFFSNNDALVSALKANEIDVALDLPATTIGTLKADRSIKVESVPGYDTILLGINSNTKRTQNPELRDPKLREALALGIDRPAINKTITLGTGGLTEGLLTPNHPLANQSLPKPTYDPAKANALLDQLGYKKGPDGIRVAKGHKMRYLVLANTATTGAPLVTNLVVDNLKRLGLQIEVRGADSAAFTDLVTAGDYTKFDFTIDDYGASFEPTHQLGLATCASLGAENESGYCNAQYDALYEKQASQHGAARQRTLDALQEQLVRDRPLIPIYSSPNIVGLRRNVNGFVVPPLVIANYASKAWIASITVK